MIDSDGLEIRIGKPEDMEACMQLAIAATAENGFLDPDFGKIATVMYSALHQDNGLVGIIGKPGGEPEGAILLTIGETWYSSLRVIEERAIFIDPAFRSAKGARARKLCGFGKTVADKIGVPLLIGVLSNSRTEAKVRMYKRQFGEPSGAFFLYGAKTGNLSLTEH